MVVHYSLWGWIVFVGISTEIKVSTPSRVVRVSDIDEERGAYELCSNCKFLNVARTKISNPNYIKLHFCVSLHFSDWPMFLPHNSPTFNLEVSIPIFCIVRYKLIVFMLLPHSWKF